MTARVGVGMMQLITYAASNNSFVVRGMLDRMFIRSR
jgi:hypothetical protein